MNSLRVSHIALRRLRATTPHTSLIRVAVGKKSIKITKADVARTTEYRTRVAEFGGSSRKVAEEIAREYGISTQEVFRAAAAPFLLLREIRNLGGEFEDFYPTLFVRGLGRFVAIPLLIEKFEKIRSNGIYTKRAKSSSTDAGDATDSGVSEGMGQGFLGDEE